jgi:hypothetical protein
MLEPEPPDGNVVRGCLIAMPVSLVLWAIILAVIVLAYQYYVEG